MNLRRFGRTDWMVSEIGYGMWGMGGWSGSNDEASRAALRRGLELGCNFLDTARAYGNGHSERLLARVLPHHRARRIYVATKIPPKNGKWPGSASDSLMDVFPPDHIRGSTETSLRHLGVDCLDLQQFHVWSDAWVDDDRWKRAVEDLKREGLIRGFGISVNRWQPANVLKAIDTGLVDAVQVVYNVFDQAPEDELFPACQRHNVAVIARVPLMPTSQSDSERQTAASANGRSAASSRKLVKPSRIAAKSTDVRILFFRATALATLASAFLRSMMESWIVFLKSKARA